MMDLAKMSYAPESTMDGNMGMISISKLPKPE